ncbi:MAG: class I SAM-dependent methyltransferase [Bacteroidetes bacterium]|nr:class I SAM-dependent methyltransferase [Bacteroidota bacterium]
MKLINNVTQEKLRGGFYTPHLIAQFILQWAFNGNTRMDILEPSCGDGVFLEEIKKRKYLYNSILAIELDPLEAKKTNLLNLEKCIVKNEEFHGFCNRTKKRFDLIVGNPPFIRYQYFDKKQQDEAGLIFNKAKLKYSKLTNSWVSFIVGSSLLLKKTGKIGFVVPAEILQVSFAKTLRKFLAKFYNKISIVSFEKLVFPDIQQEIVLLLCEKNNTKKHFIDHVEVKDMQSLMDLDVSKLKIPTKDIDFKSNKWTFYFLDQKEINFIEKIKKDPNFLTMGDFARVEVGITTGANSFFSVPYSTVDSYQLQDFAQPMVGRSVQVTGSVFTKNDWEHNQKNEARANLLVFPSKDKLKKYKGAKAYIAHGEENNIHTGYKCRIRNEWQIIPSLWASDALFLRRSNLYPKFLTNQIEAYTTDTMHRVRINKNINKDALVASYYNSLSFAFAEISGRSHGGGVLELMPNEVKDIIVPYNQNNKELNLEINSLLRKNKNIMKILKITNEKILKKNFNLSNNDIQMAHNIWLKLMERRLKRNKK